MLVFFSTCQLIFCTGQIDRGIVAKTHFGGFEGDEDEDEAEEGEV